MKHFRLLPLLLALTLTLSPALAAEPDPGFSDVAPDMWYAQAVTLCAVRGIMVGTGDGVFSPDETLSYNQCLTLALRLYDLGHGGDGVFEPAPKAGRKNAITLTFADGTSLTSYGYHRYQPLPELENHTFYSDWWQWGSNDGFFQLGLKPDGLEPVRNDAPDTLAAYEAAKDAATAWATAHEGPATLTVGDIALTGTVQCWAPGGYPELIFRGELGDPEEYRAKMAALYEAVYDQTNTVPTATPANWWQDGAWYLAQQGELHSTSYQLKFLHEDQAASRWDFAQVLYAVLGELPAARTVDVPDVERNDIRSDAVYGLYEAGVLTGIDIYGTFDGEGSFTRAQAAVMVARVLDESLRVSEPLAPLPTEGYTLTYLMDGSPDCGVNYPVCVLGNSEENEGHVGVLLLDGTLLPWPGNGEGTPSYALNSCGDYVYFGVYDETTEDPYDTRCGLMDRTGDFIVPMENGRTQSTYAIEGGFFSELCPTGGSEVWTLLDENGQLIREVPVEDGDPASLYPPKARQPYQGIQAAGNRPNESGYRYYADANGTPISQKFDWASHITADGQGFVGLDGNIYRIQFQE